MSSYEIEFKVLLTQRFYHYLAEKIIWHLRSHRQIELRDLHHQLTKTPVYLNSTRYPGYVVWFYAPHRKYDSDEGIWVYAPDDSDSDSDF